jgi:hypothetical protein
MLPTYLKALYRNWSKFLTSGGVIAFATAWVLTGNHIWRTFGIVVVFFAFLQASYAAWKEEYSRTRTDLAATELKRRREFIVTHPPKLAIIHVEYVADADWPEVRFTLVNEGGSKATIIDSKITAWLRARADQPWPPTPPYAGEPIACEAEMGRGADQRLTYRNNAEDMDLLVGDVGADNMNTVLLGYVRYRDENGDSHILGFARIRIDRTANFAASNNPEYEYSR